jgi:erythromycin esterase
MKRLAMMLLVLAACGGTTKTPDTAPTETKSEAAPPPPTRPADPGPYASLGLDFETVDGDQPRGWTTGIDATGIQSFDQERAIVGDVVHGGAHAYRFHATKAEGFVSSNVSIDAAAVRGKQLRLYGWIRTQDISAGGFASVWIRTDGGARMAFDNMLDRGVTGTSDWREVYAQVVVPDDAKTVVMGPLLVGTGTAWFDDLRIEVADIVPPHPIAFDGTVTDASGAPVADAEVALVDPAHGEIAAHVKSGADGSFHFDALSGKWGFSANKPGQNGVFVDGRAFDADATVALVFDATDGVTAKGKLVVAGSLDGAFLRISPYSQHDSDLFAVAVAPDGSFETILPRGDQYYLSGLDKVSGNGTGKRQGDIVTFDVDVSVHAPAPDEVVTWIADHAAALTSPEAGHGFDDMKAIGKMVGKAHIVGLGEATHGTREFFQLKHRVLEYLVAKKGFTVFAIEANQPECRAINEYVLHGTGDARAVIGGMYFWTWDTEEVLAMVEWMKAWNADAKHKNKVQFVGIDMQFTMVAEKNVAAFLAKVAPDNAAALTEPIAALAADGSYQAMSTGTPEARAAVNAGLEAIAKAFDGNTKAWTKATSATEYADARHDVTVMQQAMRMYGADAVFSDGFDIRDESMAANLGWIRAQQPKGTKIVVWAHNGHVGYKLFAFNNLGKHLHKTYKKDYVVFGFAFGKGSFQAITDGSLQENTLGDAPEWDLSAPFTKTGKPLLVVDLRTLPKKGIVRDWFHTPHPMRDTGAAFSSEAAMTPTVTITKLFDALIFVAETTRAKPLPAMAAP